MCSNAANGNTKLEQLAAEFPLFAERPALLAKAARQVAEALLADPGSHRRLEHLWQTLGEEAA